MNSAKEALIKVGILTVSDRCSKGLTSDESGENLAQLINSKKLFSGIVSKKECIPDDIFKIQETLVLWVSELNLNLILTVGGTGFTPRDVTPEATYSVIEKFAPAMATAMTIASLKKTQMAMLSRAVCGIRERTLIMNLPGSKKGSQECLEAVAPTLMHAVDQICGRFKQVDLLHRVMRAHCSYDSKLKTDVEELPAEQSSCSDQQKIARRPRHSPYPMITVSQAQEVCLNESPLMPIKNIPFEESYGHITARDIVAEASLPPFPASIKDGYAVISSDGAGPRKVTGVCNAGPNACNITVAKGTCARISTGAPIPHGADAVVQVEDTELLLESDEGENEIEINVLKAPSASQDIRQIGSDIQKGEIVIREHSEIGPSELGVMASAGIKSLAVYSLPATTVLSTGAEVKEPGQSLEFGCIWDSNRITLSTALKEYGFPARDGGITQDTEDSIILKFEEAFSLSDVVLSTGGVSMGEKDLLKNVLQNHFQATIHFARVFMKPGKPTTFATCTYKDKKKLVFGLPGNPASSAVTFHLYVLPCLRKMSGLKEWHANIVRTKLGHDITLDPRPEYHRGVVTWHPDDDVPTSRSTGNQISSRLASMNSANALLVLPPATDETKILKRGDVVQALLISQF